MDSFENIKSDFLNYANEVLDIRGTAVDKLCSLLAYSAYKNQVLQTADILESNFYTSNRLNSRIHFASNMCYSVPRGRCPLLNIRNITPIENASYTYLDKAAVYNGFYLFHKKSLIIPESTSSGWEPIDIQLLCSTRDKQFVEIDADSNLYSLDFTSAENVSSDYKLIEIYDDDTSEVIDRGVCTESSSDFFRKKLVDGSWEYEYKYLFITIPNYGLRVIRHSDTDRWSAYNSSKTTVKLRLEYIPYSETTPDITNIISIPGFRYYFRPELDTITEIDIIPFEGRMTSLSEIYSNSMGSFLLQGSVATEDDLYYYLITNEDTGDGIYKIYKDTYISESKDYLVITAPPEEEEESDDIRGTITSTESFKDCFGNLINNDNKGAFVVTREGYEFKYSIDSVDDKTLTLKCEDDDSDLESGTNVRFYIDYKEKTSVSDPTIASIVYSNVDDDKIPELKDIIENFKGSFGVTKDIKLTKAMGKKIGNQGGIVNNTVYVKQYPETKLLTETQLQLITEGYKKMIGRNLSHAMFEAEIVRLGFDYVQVYNGNTSSSTDVAFEIECNKWEYPEFTAKLYTGQS